MNIEFGPQIIQSYKRLSYTEWYALAEFIDNSTEAYIANKDELDAVLGNEKLQVRITYDQIADTITILDNSIGMSKEELQNALRVGFPPANVMGRSRYGLGMKTAACWLGNFWTVTTKKLNETVKHRIAVDVAEVANNQTDIHYTSVDEQVAEEHYTEIKIRALNRKFGGRTIEKVKTYLRSMYRKDFQRYQLNLFWQDTLLEWNYEVMIDARLHRSKDGVPKRRDFEFEIGDLNERKRVAGWVGVFEKGSRKDAGFSILQKDRVIKPWPDSYKPERIFGENRNDLINQRLVGELYMDDFAVSHTKDEILFLNNEREELEAKLLDVCAEYRIFASEFRKWVDDDRVASPGEYENSFSVIKSELKSPHLMKRLTSNSIPSDNLLKNIWSGMLTAVSARREANLYVDLNGLKISVYLDPELSPGDPYILTESTVSAGLVRIVINRSHPNWSYLTDNSAVENFVRHCTYEAIAEWKAKFITERLTPETIHFIKDDLLRVPFEIEEAEEG